MILALWSVPYIIYWHSGTFELVGYHATKVYLILRVLVRAPQTHVKDFQDVLYQPLPGYDSVLSRVHFLVELHVVTGRMSIQ